MLQQRKHSLLEAGVQHPKFTEAQAETATLPPEAPVTMGEEPSPEDGRRSETSLCAKVITPSIRKSCALLLVVRQIH